MKWTSKPKPIPLMRRSPRTGKMELTPTSAPPCYPERFDELINLGLNPAIIARNRLLDLPPMGYRTILPIILNELALKRTRHRMS